MISRIFSEGTFRVDASRSYQAFEDKLSIGRDL